MAGTCLLALALGADLLLGRSVDWSLFRFGLLALALLVAAVGHFNLPRRWAMASLAVSLTGGGLLLLLAVLEIIFRFTGLGAAIDRQALAAVPLYYRQPLTPFADGFYRRLGPAEWTGKALYKRVNQLGITPNPYANDPVVTARYDADGFRNETDLEDWHIAVTGDSFTELGYLPHEDLFTSVLAKQSGRTVRNLGVSYTGPWSQLEYLKTFGNCDSARHWMMVFFEGNDIEDLRAETIVRAQAAEQRSAREFDGSLIKRLDGALRSVVWRLKGTHGWPNADLIEASGRLPVTLNYAPTNPNEAELISLTQAFSAYAVAAAKAKVTPWIVYVPCKRRVWHGELEYRPNCPGSVRDWQPSDLPRLVQGSAAENGLRFLDTTEALRRLDTRPFNTVYDTHLTSAGSRAIGEVLAEAISAFEKTSAP